jgi:uncharacterized protein with von Willebrand factor type A (vWA) domain
MSANGNDATRQDGASGNGDSEKERAADRAKARRDAQNYVDSVPATLEKANEVLRELKEAISL